MNEELKQVANETLLKMLSGLDKATDFAVEQMPLVVQELLTWHFTYSLIFWVTWFLLMITTILFTFKAHKERWFSSIGEEAKKAYENGEPWTRYGGVAVSVTSLQYDNRVFYGTNTFLYCLSVPFVLLCLTQVVTNLTWLKILVAPRLFLIEYAATLVR